jgi:hypothetical protein
MNYRVVRWIAAMFSEGAEQGSVTLKELRERFM